MIVMHSEKIDMSTKEVEDVASLDQQGDYSGAVAKSDPLEIKLVRKLDMRIMPTLFCLYFLNKLDQGALANARLNGIEKDIGLKGSQYNTCISILYCGYLAAQIPSNMLISSGKVRPSWYLAAATAAWAAAAAMTGLVQDFTGLILSRFFLGVLEAPFYPGALWLLSIFYTRKEIATRISILYSGNIFATSFAGLIAAAVFETLDGAHGIEGWRWLFIIEGVITFGVALVSAWTLPDFPSDTKWLTPEERQLAHSRIQKDTVGITAEKTWRENFMEAIRDPRLYVFIIMQNMHLSATSFNQFFPTVVKSLGFSNVITLLLTCPPTLVAGAVGICIGVSSGKFNERTWHITLCMAVAMTGFIISCVTMNMPARYVSCFLFASGTYSCNSVILGWVSATLGQTSGKKSVSLALVNTTAMASFIYTPYLYMEWNKPRYSIAMGSNAGFAFVTVVCVWIMRIWLQRTNRKMKQSSTTDGAYYAY